MKKQILNDQQQQTLTENVSETLKKEPADVFLGGSCNPTTWRADVAVPELKKLGISFFNPVRETSESSSTVFWLSYPSVASFTLDAWSHRSRASSEGKSANSFLCHRLGDSRISGNNRGCSLRRAESETSYSCASALQTEPANLQGEYFWRVRKFWDFTRKFLLTFSTFPREYLDLSRNQKLLRQLVTLCGVPVLDNILTGLQKIKSIIAGEGPCDLPQSVGSRLMWVFIRFLWILADLSMFPSSIRRSYDRENNNEAGLTIAQCRQVLSSLGYRKNLITLDNLKRILSLVRDVLNNRSSPEDTAEVNWDLPGINFEEFCVVSSYLSVLQQEIDENCCVSPIKGTNLPPPPIYLTNTPG